MALLAPWEVIGRLVLLNPVGPAPTLQEMTGCRPSGAPEQSLTVIRAFLTRTPVAQARR
ncbi:hypothetical protein GCM10009539_05840 [Cryptosporangium japonicum]|uniref:Uncharacterized protein n=1 Tax=Cryptosporangium japonicum TaxID=80872 RepID=A0ABN0TJV5_9ACTN